MHTLGDNDAKTMSDQQRRMEENGRHIHPTKLRRPLHNLSRCLRNIYVYITSLLENRFNFFQNKYFSFLNKMGLRIYLLVCHNRAFVSEGDKIRVEYNRVSHIKFRYTILQYFRAGEFEPKNIVRM